MEKADRWSEHELSRRLEKAPGEIKGRYDKLLMKRQIELANENGGKPVIISSDERLGILDQAALPTTEELYPSLKDGKKRYGYGGTQAGYIGEALDKKDN